MHGVEMHSVEAARALILEGFSPLETRSLPVAQARGMVLARDERAPHPLPRFDNSAMDGYAVHRSDLVSLPVTLQVAGEVKAGDAGDVEVAAGTAVAIMTGAPIPPGADAVVPVEDTSEAPSGDGRAVTITAAPPGHGHIRPAGDDVATGDLLVAAGIELGAGELALLASMGASPVTVYRRPRVVVLSTGDELVAPEEEPGPGQIRDSNAVALKALIEEAGAEAITMGPIADDRDAVRAALMEAAAAADLVISSGGVSVGRYDHVKDVIEEIGELELWRVAMQPGKPVVSGRVGVTPFLGLPGNPVSIHVGFEQFARPAIRKMRGCSALLRPTITARMASRLEKTPGRLHFVRVRLAYDSPGWLAKPFAGQGSHIQSSLIDCHGLARFDADRSVLEAGDETIVEVWRLP